MTDPALARTRSHTAARSPLPVADERSMRVLELATAAMALAGAILLAIAR